MKRLVLAYDNFNQIHRTMKKALSAILFLFLFAIQSTLEAQTLEGATYTAVTGNPITVNDVAVELAVSSDGNRFFTIFGTALRQYNLARPFDIATATLVNTFTLPGSAAGIHLHPDDDKIYIVSGSAISMYTLSDKTDVTTATQTNSQTISALDGNLYLTFSSDGTKFFTIKDNTGTDTGGEIRQFSMTTAFDVTTASFDNVTYTFITGFTDGEVPNPTGLEISQDGTRLYVSHFRNNSTVRGDGVSEFNLATANSISSVTFRDVFDAGANFDLLSGISIANAGKNFYLIGDGNKTFGQFAMTTGYDLTTAALVVRGANPAQVSSSVRGQAISADGKTMILAGGDFLYRYNVTTAFDPSTIAASSSNSIIMRDIVPDRGFNEEERSPRELDFSSDGSKLYVVGLDNDYIYELPLSTPYNITTTGTAVRFDVRPQESSPTGLSMSLEGTKMYVIGSSGDDINQYTMTTAFDISTASFDFAFSVSGQEDAPSSIDISSDGRRMYVLGVDQNIYQYILTTPFDVSTASYESISLNVNPGDGFAANYFELSPDGKEIWVLASKFRSGSRFYVWNILPDNDPIITSPASFSVSIAENTANTTTLLDVEANDGDGGANDAGLTYSLTGDDAGLFDTSASGGLTFKAAPNFEAPADQGSNNIYNVTINISDGENTITQAATITVTNVNEAPTFSTANVASIAENSTSVTTLVATDVDAGSTLSYSLVGGSDQAAFSLSGTALSLATAPNFEGPADANTNNVYEVTVRAGDGTNNADLAISVTVTGINEAPNSLAINNTKVDENAAIGTVVGELSSTDPDASFTHSYVVPNTETNFIVSGKNLITSSIFDFEKINSYKVPVIVTDEGNLNFLDTLTITINDLTEDKPTSSITINAIENVEVGAESFELTATADPDTAKLVWSVVEGSATIDGSTLTPGSEAGLVVVKVVIDETEDYLSSEDTEQFTIADPTLISPILTLELPSEAEVGETVAIETALDPQGAATVTMDDIELKVESGPGTIAGANLTFTGPGVVEVSATLPATSETNIVLEVASIEAYQVFDLAGTALDAAGNAFTNGLAFIVATNNFNNTRSMTLDANGNFSFQNIREGQYYLGIGVSEADTVYLTTFLGDNSPISQPNAIPQVVTLTTDVSGLVINMQTKPTPAIEFVDEATGGKVEFQAQEAADGQNRMVMGRVQVGDAIPNTLVVLSTQSGEYVADGLTDEDGFITFSGLPTGDYKLGVDIPGVGRVETDVAVEEGRQADITGLISEDGTVALAIEEALATALDVESRFTVYPNPFVGTIKISVADDYFGMVEVKVYDQSGKSLLVEALMKSSVQLTKEFAINLQAGIYLLRLRYGDRVITKRIISQGQR